MKLYQKNNTPTLYGKLRFVLIISYISLSLFIVVGIMHTSKNKYLENSITLNKNIINQIHLQFTDLNNSIVNLSKSINDNSSFEIYLKDDPESADYYSILYTMKRIISSYSPTLNSKNFEFFTIGTNGNSYTAGLTTINTPINDILNSEITKKAELENGALVYQYLDKGFTSTTSKDSCIIISRVLQNIYSKEKFGNLYISISEDNFKKTYSNFETDTNTIIILDSNGKVVSSSSKELNGTTNIELLNKTSHIKDDQVYSSKVHLNNKEYVMISKYLSQYEFYIVNLIDPMLAIPSIYNLKEIFIICVSILMITLLIISSIIKSTTKPISQLAHTMNYMSKGTFKKHISLKGGYEVQLLQDSFNDMIDDLNSHIDQLMETQQKQRAAEIHALQMQINPHFMYNTLSSIKYLVLQEKYEPASNSIDAFICLLQNTISNTNEFTSVEQEIENLKNYVLILSTRYGDKIRTTFNVFPGCENCKIPKMILQPFIENAYFHGFTGKNDGLIHVFISSRNDTILCEIIDNGVGMSEENISNIYSRKSNNHSHFTGIGINNVGDRIKLLYGEDYGFSITSKEGRGTTISIVIPKEEFK